MSPDSRKFDLIFWFLKSGKKERALETGEDFGPWIVFWFGGIDESVNEVTLTFGDVPPLRLKVPPPETRE
jgi:hypothetical protein